MPGADRHRRRWALLLAVGAGLALLAGPARADHSLGLPCLTCHALRSTKVVAGSRNILSDNVVDPFYASAFYCGGSWGGGEPLDCGYCHDSLGDIASEFAVAAGGTNGSVHPVRVAADNASFANRIVCNDCHNGERADIAKDTVPDLTAGALCSKTTPSGYPNHQSVIEGTFGTGLNRLADNPPRLTGRYGPLNGATSDGPGSGSGQRGVDWQRATLASDDLLCFVCHDGVGNTDPPFSTGVSEQTNSPIATTPYPQYEAGRAANIATEYNLAGGGHNVAAHGTYSHRLPCYACHDPHAASGPDNEALILNGADAVKYSYDPTNNNAFFTTGFTGSNDRVVCWHCHNGSYRVRDEVSNTLVTPPVPTAATPVFPFHDNVHPSGLSSSGNCLQPNGGCHQSAHNTNFFRCLDCHSTNRHPNSHASLAAVSHVDSEFGNVGFVTGNGLKSYHTIVYNTAADMSVATNNGCLACHDTRGAAAGSIVRGPGDTAKQKFSGSSRENLSSLNSFCLSCHDGSGTDFGSLVAPNVGDYYANDGHGLSTGSYDSGNSAASIPCLECHLYHGSTAYKLLPGDGPTTDGVGNVVKRPNGPTTGTKFTIGNLPDSTKIDYTDYTVDNYTDYGFPTKRANEFLPTNFVYRAWYVSEYSALWTTYSDDTSLAPASGVVTTPFGTSGAMRNYNTDNAELGCGDDSGQASWGSTEKIGICNACHFYNNSTDGTTTTYGKAYSHEGVFGGFTCSGAKELKSEKNFFKDCSECHDPHGSGRRGGTTPNLYMIRGKIKHGATTSLSDVTSDGNWSRVEFTAKTGPNSYDEADTNNTDDLCAVCHVNTGTQSDPDSPNVSHNYRAQTTASHQEGNNCMVCHNHNSGLVSNPTSDKNIAAVAFGLASTCTGCHGLPPISPCDTATDPTNELVENYVGGGGAHKKHVDFIKTKLGQTTFANEWCVPCHGPNPGSAAWHLESGNPPDLNWAGEGRNRSVDIIDGASSYGAEARYDARGEAGGTLWEVRATENAKGGEPQACANLNCHGPGATVRNLNVAAASPFTAALANPGQLLWDQMCYSGNNTGTAGRTNACAGCHASRRNTVGAPFNSTVPPTAIDLSAIDPTSPYVSNLLSQGVTASYFGPPSGYSRGGHGDPGIQNEDPFVNSGTGVTPLECADCHDDTAAHFPPAAANLHRLANLTLENDLHTTGALCNSCHAGSVYPTNHHPSYWGPTGANPTNHSIQVPPAWGIQEILQNVGAGTTWTETPPGSSHYQQNAYGAGNTSAPWQYPGNPDKGIDWWGGAPGTSQSPQPRPVFFGEAQSQPPKAILPLERYIGNQSVTDRVMCVTCHNPHGTDLYVHDPGGVGTAIPDNNMLRLRDEDNTLCEACH